MIGRLLLQVGLLVAQRLQVALGQADHAVQLGEPPRLGPLHILDTGVQTQQPLIGRRTRLGSLQLLEFLGTGRRRHLTNDAALLVEHLVATTDMLRRHAVAVEHHHPAIVHITIEFGCRSQRRSQQAQQQNRAKDWRCAHAELQGQIPYRSR